MKKCQHIVLIVLLLVLSIGPGISVYANESAPVPQLGDLNQDDTIDAVDALLTLQIAVDVFVIDSPLLYADVNQDQTINAVDALWLLRFAVFGSKNPADLSSFVGGEVFQQPSEDPHFSSYGYSYIHLNSIESFENWLVNGVEIPQELPNGVPVNGYYKNEQGEKWSTLDGDFEKLRQAIIANPETEDIISQTAYYRPIANDKFDRLIIEIIPFHRYGLAGVHFLYLSDLYPIFQVPISKDYIERNIESIKNRGDELLEETKYYNGVEYLILCDMETRNDINIFWRQDGILFEAVFRFEALSEIEEWLPLLWMEKVTINLNNDQVVK